MKVVPDGSGIVQVRALLQNPAMSRRRIRPHPVDPAAREAVHAVLGEAPPRRDLLIEYLHRLQDNHGFLTTDHLAALAEAMKLSRAEVYEVATFYHHFDVVRAGEAPPPPLTVRVCDSIACEMAGARSLIDALRTALGDRVRVQAVSCVGRCECAPVAVVGRNPVGCADLDAVRRAIDAGAIEDTPPPALDLAGYRAAGGYRLYEECVGGHRQAEELIAALEQAGLRGLGGAGFSAGRKWRVVRSQPAPRLMAVNIDEGEPGTFKDRFHLERDPHRFLEGMLIAAWAVGAAKIFIYLRDEYAGVRELFSRSLDALRAAFPDLAEPPEVPIVRSKPEFPSDYQSALAMQLARPLRKPPRAIVGTHESESPDLTADPPRREKRVWSFSGGVNVAAGPETEGDGASMGSRGSSFDGSARRLSEDPRSAADQALTAGNLWKSKGVPQGKWR